MLVHAEVHTSMCAHNAHTVYWSCEYLICDVADPASVPTCSPIYFCCDMTLRSSYVRCPLAKFLVMLRTAGNFRLLDTLRYSVRNSRELATIDIVKVKTKDLRDSVPKL